MKKLKAYIVSGIWTFAFIVTATFVAKQIGFEKSFTLGIFIGMYASMIWRDLERWLDK